MRIFAKPGGLERLSLEARVVYSIFCVFMLAGYVTSAWLYLDDGLGTTARDAEVYYRGGGSEETDAPDPRGGPELDLPDDTQTKEIRFEKPPRQVIETFHFHLFSVSVCLVIIGHLYMMCSTSTRAKIAVLGFAGAATLLHIVTPPLVRFASATFSFMMFPSAAVMSATWLVMTVQPLIEMWTRLPGRRSEEE